jgi:hypothetical protein
MQRESEPKKGNGVTARAIPAAALKEPAVRAKAPPPPAAPVEPDAEAGEVFALMGRFESPAEIVQACEALRDEGYTCFDAHTPFAVHGLEKAMGLPPSRLPFIVLAAGITGLLSAIGLAWYTQAYDYPLSIGGKPVFSWQAYIPIFFELTVLFSAFGTFFGMWGLNRLPTFFHPTHRHPAFHRASDDSFLVSVEARDPKFDMKRTRELLERLGAREIGAVEA